MSEKPLLLLEENHDLPLCRLRVTVRTGAATDPLTPDGLPSGLCNFATELMRRGAAGRTRHEIDEAIDALGASFPVFCGHDSVVFQVLALKEKIEPACHFLADVLLRPGFPADEAERLRRELRAQFDDMRDDDDLLARRFFARALYGDHPYGRPVSGVEPGLPFLDVAGAKAWHERYIRSGNLVLSAAGDLTPEEIEGLFSRHFPEVPAGPALDTVPPDPAQVRGLRVLLVDKPERMQTQVLLGQLGPRWTEPSWLPLHIAATAFGGTFTARLINEVRVQRGLSYSVGARVSSARGRRGVLLHAMPAAERTAETLDLLLRLYGEWAQGISDEEVEFAQGYLARSFAFSVQTPEGRLGLRTELLLCGMPTDYVHTFPQRVMAVTPAQVREAIHQHLRPEDLLLTLVATAETMRPLLAEVEALRSATVKVVPYDSY